MKYNKKKTWSDIVWAVGLLLWLIYMLIKEKVEIPDAVAYPWMIVSCICMLIGVARCGYRMGKAISDK